MNSPDMPVVVMVNSHMVMYLSHDSEKRTNLFYSDATYKEKCPYFALLQILENKPIRCPFNRI